MDKQAAFAEIDRLLDEWGEGGRRAPSTDKDWFWMRGYRAACEQIKVALGEISPDCDSEADDG